MQRSEEQSHTRGCVGTRVPHPRAFAADACGATLVEYLVIVALLGLGMIGVARSLSMPVASLAERAGRAIQDMSPLEAASGAQSTAGPSSPHVDPNPAPTTGSALAAAASTPLGVASQPDEPFAELVPIGHANPAASAARPELVVRAGAPTVGALHGPGGAHAASDQPSTIIPAAGAVVGGAAGFVLSGGVAVVGTALSGGVNAPFAIPEVLGGTALGAAVGYTTGVFVERMQEQIAQAEQWVNERVRDGIGWLGERAGAGVDWVEERAESAVDWVRGLFNSDEGTAEEQSKKEAKKEQVRKDRAMREYRTNKRFKEYFHRDYKGDQGMPRGGLQNPNMDEGEVLEAWEEWEAQQPGHDVP
mgnify:CR=1 FL=1